MKNYKIVAFDFDGTLADSMPWFVDTLDLMADRYRFRKVNQVEVAMLRGLSTREILQYMGIGNWQIPLIVRDLRKMSARAAPTIPLFEGVSDLLDDLVASGIAVGIVSSNEEQTIRSVLGRCESSISHYVCGISLFGKAKRLEGLRRELNLDQDEILYVGDELRDIEAAQKAKIDSGAVTWGYATEKALLESRSTYIFRCIEDIRAAVNR